MSDHHNHGNNRSEAPPDPSVSTKNPVTGEDVPEGYMAVFEPNHFMYDDNEGTRHSIHLPASTYGQAMKYYEEGNWDDLAKFPVWSIGLLIL